MERYWLLSSASIDVLSSTLLLTIVAQAHFRRSSRFSLYWLGAWSANCARALLRLALVYAPDARLLIPLTMMVRLVSSFFVLAAAMSLDEEKMRNALFKDRIILAGLSTLLVLTLLAPIGSAEAITTAAARSGAAILFFRSYRTDKTFESLGTGIGLLVWACLAIFALGSANSPQPFQFSLQIGGTIQFFVGASVAYRMAHIERREADKTALSLIDAEIRFLSIIENAPEAIALVDSTGRFTLTNRYLRDFAGIRADDAMDKVFIDFIHPDDRDAIIENFRAQVDGFRDRYRLRARFIGADGSIAWGDLSSSVIRNEDGDFRFGVGIISDVTELVEEKEKSAEALAEKEQLLREMHHRIKNNLQIITSLLALQDGRMASPPATLALEETMDRVHSIAVAHELAYLSVDMNTVDLAALVARIAQELDSSSYAAAGVELAFEGAEVFISLDKAVPTALAITELVANAHLHAFVEGKGGHLWVSVRDEDGMVIVKVSDDGPGIDFDPAKARMTAAGLTMVIALASQLGGTAAWDSEHGLSCEFRFPRRDRARGH